MKLNQRIIAFLINVLLIHGAIGQVYINPNNPPPVASSTTKEPVIQQEQTTMHYETQTVYGFLDFTTTIGNTVMIFSPQSAPPPEPPKTTTEEPTTTSVIETRPPTTPSTTTTGAPIKEVTEIKPSKTLKPTSKKDKEIVSIVQVVAETPKAKPTKPLKPKPKVQKIQVVSSEVNVVEEVATKTPKIQIISSDVNVVEEKATKIDAVKAEPSSLVNVAPTKVIYSKVEVVEEIASSKVEAPVVVISSQVNVVEEPQPSKVDEPTVVYSSIVEPQENEEEEEEEEVEEGEEEEEVDEDEPVLVVENNIGEPEYDFLSRQPSEYAEETFRVINLKPTNTEKKFKTKRNSQSNKDETHPTGLVTKLGGTVVKDGVTTVHETSVIGTYISGKYAQVLQSTSHFFQGNVKPRPTSSSSLRILKTAAPNLPKSSRYIDPTPASNVEDTGLPESVYENQPNSNLIRPSRRPAISGTGSFKNRFRSGINGISRKDEDVQQVQEVQEEIVTPSPPQIVNPYNNGRKNGKRNGFGAANGNGNGNGNGKSGSSKNVELATVFSEPSTPSYQNRKNKSSRFRPVSTTTTTQMPVDNRRTFKPKLNISPVENDQTTTLYKFKLNRSPGRWQYKTTPKPRITIRKQEGNVENLTTAPLTDTSVQYNDIGQERTMDDVDLDQEGSVNGDVLNDEELGDNKLDRRFPVETLKVEISTAADFSETYYEIATIKSPYTFQVGTVKNTRYITVTSTFEKTFEPEPTISATLTEPLTENILASTTHIDKEHNLLDSSIATLPPISLASDAETPPLETLTETFNTTQQMLKTHILPVIRGGTDTTSYTLIQTYHITRLVTATKTLPPMELYHFVPSKTLHEFNSRLDEAGSELHLELEFGDDEENDDEDTARRTLPDDLDLANIGSDFDLNEFDNAKIPENQTRPKKKIIKHKVPEVTTEAPQVTPNLTPDQLQQLAFLRLLNPAAAAQIPSVITSSIPKVRVETIYESRILPITNGLSTIFSTISRSIGTVMKTDYEVVTTTLPSIPTINPFQQQSQQQFSLQSTPVVTQTIITEVNSKILKLTFGAKTAYTTLFSTKVVPTVLTTYLTNSIPVQQTANAFPGYFPAPYPPYPYVG